ncbi:MAG: tetratricopeptide repeat protein [Uliginosibacterium sp.]|nr:tetratricopeptide repeat protein [Uliginosibacterium sp.]
MRHQTSPARPASRSPLPPSEQARQIFQLISRGAFQEASLVSEHAVVLHPKSAEVLNAAAVAAIHTRHPQRAEALWRQCIKIAPGQAIAYLNLGKFYFNTKRLSDAEPLLRKALALNPKSADSLNALGALHQAQGDFPSAHATYGGALTLDPGKAETLNNLDICLTEIGQYAEAERTFLRLRELPGQHATALARLGMLAEAQGDLGKAREHFEAALSTDPSNVITATQYAALLRKTGDAEKAVKILEALQTRLAAANPILLRALAQAELARGNDAAAHVHLQRAQMSAPEDLETLQMRAELAAHSKDLDTLDALLAELPQRIASGETAAVETARIQLMAGRPSAALACIQSAQQVLGKSAPLMCLEGDAYIALHTPDQAEAAFREALRLTQTSVKAHLGLGFALIARAAYPEARLHYEQSLQRHPGNVLLRAGLAQSLLELGDLEQAKTILEPLYTAQPQNAVIATTYSHYARLTGKLAEALKAAQDAVRQSPNERAANTALIAAYEETGHLALATRLARELVAAHPADSDTQLRLAMLLLAQGHFSEGWAAYEARLVRMLDTDHPYTRAPRWQGEPLQGKTLLVAHEQGMGDELQFFRYLQPLQDKFDCTVQLVCKPPLHTLLNAQQICPVHSYEPIRAEDLPSHDYWAPLMSIPHLVRTTIPDIPQDCPYLRVPDHKICQWREHLAQDDQAGMLKVGVIWKGNPNHQNDARRSLQSLDVLAPLLGLSGIRFFDLQKDTSTSESAFFAAQYGLVTPAPAIVDVLDTAAIMAQLDLVISIDSMPAHLAGALGVPCWIMLPACAEWRWMTDRDDTPWYPQTRLYRQNAAGDWTGVVQRVGTELSSYQTSTKPTDGKCSIGSC